MKRKRSGGKKEGKRVSKGKGMECGGRYGEKEQRAKQELKCLACYEERKFIL